LVVAAFVVDAFEVVFDAVLGLDDAVFDAVFDDLGAALEAADFIESLIFGTETSSSLAGGEDRGESLSEL
jgi:hypothetical protein